LEYGRIRIKLMVLLAVVAFMLLAVDGAYAMGGGGRGGDGRWDFSKSTGTGSTGGADNGFVTPACPRPDPPTVSAVPEPLTVCLVGFGLVGLAGLRRKFKKQENT
jgi:PEP-CTERM motif